MFGRQPVAQSDTQLLHALDAPDPSGQVGAEEAAIRRLVRKAANCPQPEIDRAWGEMSRLEVHSIADHYRLAEGQSRLGTVPNGDTFINEKPRVWADKLGGIQATQWDLMPDGKCLLVLAPVASPEAPKADHEIVFLENFFDELRRKVPVTK